MVMACEGFFAKPSQKQERLRPPDASWTCSLCLRLLFGKIIKKPVFQHIFPFFHSTSSRKVSLPQFVAKAKYKMHSFKKKTEQGSWPTHVGPGASGVPASLGQGRTGQGRAGQDRAGQDRTGEDRTGEDRAGQDRTGEDRTEQNRTRQDRAGQDRAEQDRAGQERTGQDKAGQVRTGQDRTR